MRRIAFATTVLLALPAVALAEGMPQLDFKNPLTTSQVVWLAVIFSLLYLLLSRWALPKVADVLEARAVAIGEDLEAARKAKFAADAAVAASNEATRKAQVEAQAEIAASAARAKETTLAQAAELSARLEAQLVAAEQRINAARASAMGALRQVATDTADVVITRLTGTAPARAALELAVGDVLAARGQG